jgi:hypothetical protein
MRAQDGHGASFGPGERRGAGAFYKVFGKHEKPRVRGVVLL